MFTYSNIINKLHFTHFLSPQRYEQTIRSLKVSVLGAMSSIGQPLCLLLKTTKGIDEIAIYDMKTEGLAKELNSISPSNHVKWYEGKDVFSALVNSDVVLMVDGVSYYGSVQNMPQNIFTENCKCVYKYAKAVKNSCPHAFVGVVTNPLTCTLPIAHNVINKNVVKNNHKILGVNTLQSIRTNKIICKFIGLNPSTFKVPVVGGSSPNSAVPIFSKSVPQIKLTLQNLIKLHETLRTCNENQAKNQFEKLRDTFSLSFAYATREFVQSLIAAISENKTVTEHAIVVDEGTRQIIGSPVSIDGSGVRSVFKIPTELTGYEYKLIEEALNKMNSEAEEGVKMYQSFLQDDKKIELFGI